ncbi:MAG: PilW family protein [Burkholderiaceae bacterium]|nr:PilW family protein [Burkholderiaceae bacterium]
MIRATTRRGALAGMTLTELLIAVAVGLLVMLAAVSALSAARRGAGTVDAASQLRDNARFAADIIQRLAVQAGFEDLPSASAPYADSQARYALINPKTDIRELPPNVFGYDNATPNSSDPFYAATPRTASDGGNGSDVLILQYQAALDLSSASGYSDGSMITCAGNAPKLASTGRDDRIYSVLSVAKSVNDEPALMCTYRSEKTGKHTISPLVAGVESFQVLYGVDHVTPGATLGPGNAASSIPNGYLRAAQLTVPGDLNATYANWRRVRSLRIGMVLRGPDRSAQGAAAPQKLFPLGSRYASAADPGSSYTATDARLRQTVTFTVHLRNCQNQGYQSSASTLACDVILPQ